VFVTTTQNHDVNLLRMEICTNSWCFWTEEVVTVAL